MSRMFKGFLLLLAVVGLYQAVALANGSTMPSSPGGASSRMLTPEERAVESYNNGVEHKDKGRKLEEQAAAKQGADAVKLAGKARSEYEKALKDFKNAAQANPKLFQAYNGMGFSLRKTGDFAKALVMYDQAIGMASGFYAEAVEYRAEAYLGLNRMDDARQAYLDLFGADRKQADVLMATMKSWVAARHADSAGVDPAALAAFEQWLGERDGLAKQTRLMAVGNAYAGW